MLKLNAEIISNIKSKLSDFNINLNYSNKTERYYMSYYYSDDDNLLCRAFDVDEENNVSMRYIHQTMEEKLSPINMTEESLLLQLLINMYVRMVNWLDKDDISQIYYDTIQNKCNEIEKYIKEYK